MAFNRRTSAYQFGQQCFQWFQLATLHPQANLSSKVWLLHIALFASSYLSSATYEYLAFQAFSNPQKFLPTTHGTNHGFQHWL